MDKVWVSEEGNRRLYNPNMFRSSSGSPILYCSFCAFEGRLTVEAHYVISGYSVCQLHFERIDKTAHQF